MSGDRMDVFFEGISSKGKECWICVEVKSKISDKHDIQRGLYQCVKYRAVMEKEILAFGIQKDVRVILALGCEFPQCLDVERRALGIEDKDVKENIKAA